MLVLNACGKLIIGQWKSNAGKGLPFSKTCSPAAINNASMKLVAFQFQVGPDISCFQKLNVSAKLDAVAKTLFAVN